MKIYLPKIFLFIVFIVTISASIFGGRQEASVLSERNTVPIGAKKNPLKVKGIVYFVTDDQLFYYEASKEAFIFGSITGFALIVWLSKQRKKN